MSLESVTCAPGTCSCSMAAASCSMLVFTGEKTEETAMAVIRLPAISLCHLADLIRIERRDLAPVELVTPVTEVGVAPEHLGQIVGPVDHRWQRQGRRQSQSHRGGRFQPLALDDGIREVGRADHDAGDLGRRRSGRLQDVSQRGGDAGGHVGSCRRLDLADDRQPVHEHGIGIGAADVDPDAQTHADPFPSSRRLHSRASFVSARR